ncbi:MAG: hypothetical protein AMK70_01085 [Nitrospira bacterium SG8_35_1]|nr:MAG: hypothetical protein AMK70_01085 [Nitrospira bacterium SG8_35_1]
MNKENMNIPVLEPLNETDDIYQRNLHALEKHHPELIEMIETISVDEDRVRVVKSESGNPRIIFKKDGGEEVNIHSTDDPVNCANQAIDLLGKIEKEGMVVLFGFGLGYFAEEVLDRFEKGHMLLMYEATPEVFKLALQVKDFSELLGSEQVKIILGEDADNFSVIHSHHHLIINGKFWVVKHEPSVKLNSNAYDNFFTRLNEEKSLSNLSVATNVRRGEEFMNACLLNLHSVIKKPGVKEMKDIYAGCTAIVVSAGPSLDKNIHLLKKVKGKAVIIATGGALPTLLTCEIVPDIVVEIDPVTENIEDKFQECPELKNVPFICLAAYTPELVNIYPGPLFINGVGGNLAYQWLANYWEDKGIIECFGGSVAHLAFATAEHVGADVIALIGQDLSYTGDRLHTVGYSDDLDRRLEVGAEKKQENILGGIPVRDIFGEEVLSIVQFMSFKTSFENRIKLSKKVIINATEAGLSIDGARNMRFMDFIDEYCNGQKEIDAFSVLSGLLDSKINCDLDGLIDEVSRARKKYEEIKKASKQILKYSKKVKQLKGKDNIDSPELNNILRKVQVLIENVKDPLLNVLAGYNYGLELYLKKQEIKEIDDIDDKWEMLDKQLERGQIYYSQIVKTIVLFNKQLDKVITALKREKNIDSLLHNDMIEQNERFHKAGMMYKRAGLAAQAVRYLEAAISDQQSAGRTPEKKSTSSMNELYISLAEMYVKQFRFYDARKILEELVSYGSGTGDQRSTFSERIQKLLRICDKKIKAWQGKKNKMGALLRAAEANYGSHLESGYFYFRIKNYERAEQSYLKAIKDEESGVRSQELGAAYYGLAHTYLAMDDPDKAVGALEKALEADPSNPLLYRDLGLIAVESNNIAPAEIFLSKAIELAPQEAEFYKPLANLYMSIGETEKASALYESAIQANADLPVIQQHLAEIYKETISIAEGRPA